MTLEELKEVAKKSWSAIAHFKAGHCYGHYGPAKNPRLYHCHGVITVLCDNCFDRYDLKNIEELTEKEHFILRLIEADQI